MKRRTEKDRAEITRLKKIVVDKLALHKITAYEIGEKVDNITFPTVLNIMNGTTKHPSKEKLEAILEYIKTVYETEPATAVAEQRSAYRPKVTLENIYDAIKSLEQKIEEGNTVIIDSIQESDLHQQLIFEYITSGKAAEVAHLQKQIKNKTAGS